MEGLSNLSKINCDNVWFLVLEVWLESLHLHSRLVTHHILGAYYLPGTMVGIGDIEWHLILGAYGPMEATAI